MAVVLPSPLRGTLRLSLLGLVCACSAPPDSAEDVRLPIVGGSDAAACAWPAVVLVGDDCSGTLVHPQVVVTAAHCVDGKTAPLPKTVSFGERALDAPIRTVKVSRCAPSPKYDGGDTDDIGYCLLEQAVTDVPIVPIMAACEASALKAGVDVMEVGFGQAKEQSGANDGFGVKRLIAAKIDAVTSKGQINVTTGNQSGEYYGDSGGPIFFQMPDKTWRFIGDDCCAPDIVSGSNQARVSTYISAPPNLAWLESASAVDVTVCHDGSRWSPGTLCAALPTTPDKASGGWASLCASQSQLAPQPTCTNSGGSGGGSSGGAAGAGGSSAGAGGATGGASGSGGANATGGVSGANVGGATTAGAAGTAGNISSGGGGSGGVNGGAPTAGGANGGLPAQGGSLAAAGVNSHAASEPSGCACTVPVSRGDAPWAAMLATLTLALTRRRARARQDAASSPACAITSA